MRTRDEEARELARKHYEIERGLTQIFRVMRSADDECEPAEPIKLLEVNAGTVPSGIMRMYFGPSTDLGYYYPSVVLQVTPEEFRGIQQDELKLPNGWKIAEFIPKPFTENAP
jgi:hypothetical protein